MKIEKFQHNFIADNGIRSSCIVHMIEEDEKSYILFEDINVGSSVTNSSELIAGQIVNIYNLNPKNCRFFETYEDFSYDTFDEIEYSWNFVNEHYEAKNPRWRPGDLKIKRKFLNDN
jgi:hypothetical protein